MPLTFLCLAALAIDGDTLRCAGIGDVRLARIDAPELPGHCRESRDCAPGDPWKAKARLASLVAGRKVRCIQADALPWTRRFETRDRYGRIVARCSAGGADLGQAMIRSGLAVKWP